MRVAAIANNDTTAISDVDGSAISQKRALAMGRAGITEEVAVEVQGATIFHVNGVLCELSSRSINTVFTSATVDVDGRTRVEV